MPGLLKLNPDVLELPKPYVQGREYSDQKLGHKNKYKKMGMRGKFLAENIYDLYKQ